MTHPYAQSSRDAHTHSVPAVPFQMCNNPPPRGTAKAQRLLYFTPLPTPVGLVEESLFGEPKVKEKKSLRCADEVKTISARSDKPQDVFNPQLISEALKCKRRRTNKNSAPGPFRAFRLKADW